MSHRLLTALREIGRRSSWAMHLGRPASAGPIDVTDAERKDAICALARWTAFREFPSPIVAPTMHDEVKIDRDVRAAVWHAARAIGRSWGIFPISFAYLRPGIYTDPWLRWVSEIVPGEPYSYMSEDAYRREYASSVLAITHKKGGWDCHRHLEILFAGSIPFMPDADAIPYGTMQFYPKAAMQSVRASILGHEELDLVSIRHSLSVWAESVLTAEAMAEYVLSVLPEASKRMFFVDPHLARQPDYLSLQLLAGFVRTRLTDVHVAERPEYLWEASSNSHLYGRGFGYSGCLESDDIVQTHPEMTSFASVDDLLALCREASIDTVVFGSVHRNTAFCESWIQKNSNLRDPVQTVVVDGGDDSVWARDNGDDWHWLIRFARELVIK